ncbi:STAS domain-containing protein [Vreelandella nigrificans]|uniref:Anti-anti-sigma factor n=1 Tax=Vreelandella nigrificans TaxID=2042704 RepID=A0A2A4HQL9_9GAMM|nr:STAS domain-containing protein [Halomonas nigrificans]PCF97222.1 anti-anti-sigma factor [Halomonas nigrificans]
MTLLLSRPSVSLDAQGHTLKVSGDVDVNAAAELAAVGMKWLKGSGLNEAAFDFSGVAVASSVAISVLFEWMRTCNSQQIAIESILLSAPLNRLASLAELDELIAHPGEVF